MKNHKKPKIFFLKLKQPSYWTKAAESNFVSELRSVGYEIDILEHCDENSNRFTNEVENRVLSYKYDLVITELNHRILPIKLLKVMRQHSNFVLMPNDNALIPFRHKKIARYFDLVWLLDNQNINLFKKWSKNIIHLPWAGNRMLSNFYCPESNQIARVLFIGTPHGSRVKQINRLLANHIPVTIYSNFVLNNTSTIKKRILFPIASVVQHLLIKSGRKIIMGKILSLFHNDEILNNKYLEILPSIEANEMACLYRKYRLSWSSVYARNTGYLSSPLITLNLRSFEIPISGGLQFVARNDELEKYFTDGKDVVFYDEENFVETAKYYLFTVSNTKIIEMKRNAQNNALKNHTWESRFNKIFDILGINH